MDLAAGDEDWAGLLFTEAGQLQLTRRGRLVFLDVAIDGRRHQQILKRFADRDAWEWADEPTL